MVPRPVFERENESIEIVDPIATLLNRLEEFETLGSIQGTCVALCTHPIIHGRKACCFRPISAGGFSPDFADTSKKADNSAGRSVMATRSKFSDEYKREAVRLATQPGVTKSQVASELGINANLLGR